MKALIAALALVLASSAAAQQYQFPHWEVATGVTGTEIRDLVAFKGKLYASNGYWMDQADNSHNSAVLALDAPDAKWREDVNFGQFCPANVPRCALTTGALSILHFEKDKSGDKAVADILVASLWLTGMGKNEPLWVLAKNNTDGKWFQSVLASAPVSASIRAFGSHVDAVTGESLAFTGAGSLGVVHGWLADKRPAGVNPLVWETNPEASEWKWENSSPTCNKRIMAFAESGGKLFFSECFDIWVRTDGKRGSCNGDEVQVAEACEQRWRKFWSYPGNPNSESGLRGMSAFEPRSEKPRLIVGYEGVSATITGIDALTGASETELDITDTLEQAWGIDVGYIIAAYSPPMPYWVGSDGRGRRIVGFEAFASQENNPSPPLGRTFNRTDDGQLVGEGWYFVRDRAHSWRLFQIPPITARSMVAVRAAASSPFPQECNANGQDCAIYFGGFDANKGTVQTPCRAAPCDAIEPQPTHGTGWIVKGFAQ